LLGIVSDWTTNFIDHYEVQFITQNENEITKNIFNYIIKYEPNTDVKKEILEVKKETLLEKSVWYLLNWTFENIAYSRKQSLKTLTEWCNEFINDEQFNSEEFKTRIDNYFIFSDITFILQDIGENPLKHQNWFETFYYYEESDLIVNGVRDKKKIYIPDIKNVNEKKLKFERLRDNISRFLESYRNNLGLNFISGFIRLALNEYDDSDGKLRFESALNKIKQTFLKSEQDDFLNRLKILGNSLNEEQKMFLCESLSKFFPENLEEFAEFYDLAYLLNDEYSKKITKIKKLNKLLYEQIRKI
jgi:ATP-dependent DNA helicase RecQ